MNRYSLRKICWIFPLFIFTACPVPDVDEYSELTREMTTAIKTSSHDVVRFLNEGLASQPGGEEEIDPLLLEDLAGLQGEAKDIKSANYPKELKNNWRTIYGTLDALVAYSDALVGMKESGAKGRESFNNLANSLNNVLAVTGIAPVSASVTKAGSYIYGAIAQIKARNNLEDVITHADIVIQHVAVKLDSALYYMEIVNDVALSGNLLKKSDSKEAQQLRELYESFVEKEKRNRVKITLLNDYDNGDYESLKAFVYEDPVSLNKLGINELSDQIGKINATGGLSPRERLDKISQLAKTTFKPAVDGKLTNTKIVNTLDIYSRRDRILQELHFIREEVSIIAPEYLKNIEEQKEIETVAELHQRLIKNARKLIRSWSRCHSQMKRFLTNKQKISFNEIKLYINDIKALKAELDEQ